MPDLRRTAACLTIALASTGLTATATAAQKFKAFVAYDDGACSDKGLNVFVTMKFPSGTTDEKARVLQQRFAPRGKGRLEVGGDSYTLSPKRSRDFADDDRAAWFFGVVRIDEEAAEDLLGTRAELSYKTEVRPMRFTARVAKAGC